MAKGRLKKYDEIWSKVDRYDLLETEEYAIYKPRKNNKINIEKLYNNDTDIKNKKQNKLSYIPLILICILGLGVLVYMGYLII